MILSSNAGAGSRDLDRDVRLGFSQAGSARVLDGPHGAADGEGAGTDTVVVALIVVAMPFMNGKGS